MSLDSRSVDSQRPSTVGDALRTRAKEAESQGSDTVQRVMIGSKAYYVVVVRDGRLQPLQHDTQKIQDLARVIVNAHSSSPSMSDKQIDYIDSRGAHSVDEEEAPHAHTDALVSQKDLHAATEGLSGITPKDPLFKDDSSIQKDNSQLTIPQHTIVKLRNFIGNNGDTITAKQIQDIISQDPTLPQEFKDELALLIQTKKPTDTLTQQDLKKAFFNACLGSDFDIDDLETPFGGYLGRLIIEHNAGVHPSKIINAAEYKQFLKENNRGIDCDLYELNFMMMAQRTAQHAWNAMTSLASDVDHLSHDPLRGIQSGTYLLPMDHHNEPPLVVSFNGMAVLPTALSEQQRDEQDLFDSMSGVGRDEYEEISSGQPTAKTEHLHSKGGLYQNPDLPPLPQSEHELSFEEARWAHMQGQNEVKKLLLLQAIKQGLLEDGAEGNESLSVDQLEQMLLAAIPTTVHHEAPVREKPTEHTPLLGKLQE